MQTSPFGKQALQTLSVRTDTLNKSDKGGTPSYTYEKPYAVITDDFRSIADSPDATSDEKALAQLGLRMNDSWGPGAGISKREIFQAHMGMLETVKPEYSQSSEANVGTVLARATLGAVDNALEMSPGMAFWRKDGLNASLLEAGFQAICDSNASNKQKSIAKKSLKALQRFDDTGELPTAEMKKIANS